MPRTMNVTGRPRPWHGRRGFSLAESVLAVLFASLMILAALTTVGAAKRREGVTLDKLRGQQLASDLLNEILMQAYQDPGANPVFGPEPGESTGTRASFNDVDDYSGVTTTPPTDKNGNVLAGFTGWTRSVNVVWADPNTLGSTSASMTGLKQITVTVSKLGKTTATLVGYRSIAWVDTIPSPTDATGNHSPVAVATASHTTRHVGQSINFSAATSSDADGDYLSYVWNFGDGTMATGTTATKSYGTVGSYICTLIIYDGRGGAGQATLAMTIN